MDGSRRLQDPAPTLTLAADGRLVGHGGADHYFGIHESPATGDVRFGALGATTDLAPHTAAGADPQRRFLETLGQIDRYRVTPRRLRLLSGDKTRLVFEPVAATADGPAASPGATPR